ncbi:hypothetical protein C8R45DRAFT_990055 [Mycena sanguinolenta]|nr:hypothetical protein C8R45DRAFT_990055 [Mycena sanguinolenta]
MSIATRSMKERETGPRVCRHLRATQLHKRLHRGRKGRAVSLAVHPATHRTEGYDKRREDRRRELGSTSPLGIAWNARYQRPAENEGGNSMQCTHKPTSRPHSTSPKVAVTRRTKIIERPHRHPLAHTSRVTHCTRTHTHTHTWCALPLSGRTPSTRRIAISCLPALLTLAHKPPTRPNIARLQYQTERDGHPRPAENGTENGERTLVTHILRRPACEHATSAQRLRSRDSRGRPARRTCGNELAPKRASAMRARRTPRRSCGRASIRHSPISMSGRWVPTGKVCVAVRQATQQRGEA